MLNKALQNRRNLGLGLYVLGQLVGGSLLVLLFGLPALLDPSMIGGFCFAAVLALPAAALYLTLPRMLDRYDPEPWYALLGALLWGGIAACGFSATINSLVGALGSLASEETGQWLGTVVSAPIVEESFKGLGVLGVAYFLKHEFDGIVDGILYATFIALGFAAVENVVYYAEALSHDALAQTVVARGILFPWGHPVYTSMFGVGLGMARETSRPWVRIAAPVGGFALAVTLHALWNASAMLADHFGDDGKMLFIVLLPFWFLLVVGFFVLVVVLVRRRGRIIREYLVDEVALGNLLPDEVTLITSAFGLARARRMHGDLGVQFVRAAARLALSKWHATRAYQSNTHTFSIDFIVPLRAKLKTLRGELYARQSRSR